MASPPEAFSIAFAHWTALGHANAGFGLYRQLDAKIKENGGKLPDVPDLAPIVVPAVTNMAFAVELFMKVHAFQLGDKYPSGHDITALDKNFTADQRENLRVIYKSLMSAPEFVHGFVLDLSGGPKGKPGVPAPQLASPQSYDEAVQEIGASYVKWRYAYESFSAEAFRHRISFPTLWILIQTLLQAIRAHKGSVTIRATEQARATET